jgi:hypothetical protein
MGKMIATGSKLHYDLFSSRSYVNRNGFKTQSKTDPDPNNVSYTYADGSPVSQSDFMQVVANLEYDPRAPVFVPNPTNSSLPADFRFYLDFDRNRRFEDNGLLPEIDALGNTNRQSGTNVFRWMVGDPEWVGVLERPDLPHSETNRFIGRMAYLALPVGKTLDMNFIHNQTDFKTGDDDMTPIPARNGFSRNQGYGPWEINLAAFLRELNTNLYAWPAATYKFLPQQAQTGFSFDDARALLNFRYTGRRSYLSNAFSIGPNNFAADFIDNYGDGPLVFGPYPDPKVNGSNFSEDDPKRPWPGSLSSNAFTDVQQLFTVGNYSPGFTNRLQQPMAPTRKSTYDRYTFYRLLSQLGVDSSPAHKGKLNLNYQNTIGELTNNLIPWTNALAFFTNAADMMLKASVEQQVRTYGRAVYTNFFIGDTPLRPEFSLTNILIYATPRTNLNPNTLIVTNEYTAPIHRLLQVAVNIYDNTTNKGPSYPYYPTVFRPYFYKTPTNLSIAGFLEITNVNDRNQMPQIWTNAATWVTQSPSQVGLFTNINVYGQPFIVGVKKGHPNFNEFAIENVVEISRKIELGKANAGASVTQTNEQYVVSIQSRLGSEAWNSYRTNYNRPVRIFAEFVSEVALSNRPPTGLFEVPIISWPQGGFSTNYNLVSWPGRTNQNGGNFQVPMVRSVNYLQDAVYMGGNGPTYFTLSNSVFGPLVDAPHFRLYTTNRVRFMITALSGPDAGRIIDFVNLDDLKTVLDIGTLLRPQSGSQVPGQSPAISETLFWDTNRIGLSGMTVGISNQLAMSRGDLTLDEATWKKYSKYLPSDRDRSIDEFRVFSGTNQTLTGLPALKAEDLGTRHQAPFTPTRRIYARYSWQANDPLVHYMNTDLAMSDAAGRTLPDEKPKTIPYDDLTIAKQWNIGRPNIRYEPWDSSGTSKSPTANPITQIGFKDPNIRNSDDWRFPIVTSPTNYLRFPSIGWLGRVHRGTPWQTIYMKPIVRGIDAQGRPVPLIDPTTWYNNWAHNIGSFPSQDYKLFDLFTVAPTESATRGLLSVNQEGQAAWSAVLSGITVFTNNISNEAIAPPDAPADPYTQGYTTLLVEPGSKQLSNIVASINFVRTNQFDVGPITDPARPQVTYDFYRKQVFGTGNNLDVFEHVGDVLNAPLMSRLSPYLREEGQQASKVWVDEAVERIPQQIMSLLQRDEPKFVVYAFGQSLKPAPHSLVTSANFYNLCTNYQITGEVISKTTFRVEGELNNAKNPLRAVVESYNVLPPPD